MKPTKKITLKQARRVLEVVDAGLCKGVGIPVAGEMCVEAAVCFALGEPFGDQPSCVSPVVRAFKIQLNDSNWSSNEARATGMRRIAIAQLGTAGEIDEKIFVQELVFQTVRQIVPIALRTLKVRHPRNAERYEGWAVECEAVVDFETAKVTIRRVRSAAAAADAADAADAAAAAAVAAADAAADAAAKRDSVLTLAAEIGVQALRRAGAAGVKLLDKLIK